MKVYGSLEKAQLENLASDPTPASEGLIYFNTADNEIRAYLDGEWIVLADEDGLAGIQAQIDAADAATATVAADLATDVADLADHIADAAGAHAASAISFSPTGNTSSTTVQAAIVELQGDINTIAAGGGATLVGTLDNETPVAEGAVIDSGTLYMQSASETEPGLVNNAAQSFSGDKTFADDVAVEGALAVTGALTTNATASRALTTNGSSVITASATTATELGYVNGVTSAIQTQLDAKAASVGNLDSGVADAKALQLASGVLTLQSASASNPGVVNTTAQAFAGYKRIDSGVGVGATDTNVLGVNADNSVAAPGANKRAFHGAVTATDTAGANATSTVGFYAAPAIGAANTQNWTNATGAIIGFHSDVRTIAASAGTVTRALGSYVKFQNLGVGTVTGFHGYLADTPTNPNGGTVTGVSGFTVASQVLAGANNTGVLIGTTTVPTGSFALYNASSLPMFSFGSLCLQRADVASTATIAQLASSTSLVVLTGSTATTIQGIAAGKNGQLISIHNPTTANMTIAHENASATAADRIVSSYGADVIVPPGGIIDLVYHTGNARWYTKINRAHAPSEVWVHTANGHGSTNNKIRRFTTTVTNTGTAISYTDSDSGGGAGSGGARFLVNETGLYHVSYWDQFNANYWLGISRNSAQLTTSILTITAADRIAMAAGTSNATQSVHALVQLVAGDIIRPHTEGGTTGSTTAGCGFRITKVG